jgi:hypothetical protein
MSEPPSAPAEAARALAAVARQLHEGHRAGFTCGGLAAERVEIRGGRAVLRVVWERGGDPAEDVAALGALVGSWLGEPESVVLAAVVRRAVQPGGFRTAEEVARALEAWIGSPPVERLAPVRRELRAILVLRVLTGAALVGLGGSVVLADLRPPAPPYVIPVDAPPSLPAPEPLRVEGVLFSPGEAERVLAWVEAADLRALRGAGLSRAAAEAVIAGRPVSDLHELAAIPGVGAAALRALLAVDPSGDER